MTIKGQLRSESRRAKTERTRLRHSAKSFCSDRNFENYKGFRGIANGCLLILFIAAGMALVGANTAFNIVLELEKKTAIIGTHMGAECCIEFWFELGACPIFGHYWRCINHFPRIPPRSRVNGVLCVSIFLVRRKPQIHREERLRLGRYIPISVLMGSVLALQHTLVHRFCRYNLSSYYACVTRPNYRGD
jgi:hypothetical protein